MKKKIRTGIVGCGNIAGWNELDPIREKPCTHIGAYRTRKDVEVVGCCDADIRRARKFAKQFNIRFYTDSLGELLSRKIDILSICVPYKLHFKVLKSAVNGKNKPGKIFLEKPISNDLSKAEEMVGLCKRNKVKLYVNNRRLSAFYRTFQKIIKEKFNNKIISLSSWCSSGMHTIGIHMIDLLRNICGEVNWVFAVGEKEKIDKLPYSYNFTPDDPRFYAFVGFKNGIKATLFNSARTDFTYFEIEGVCKTGRIRVADNGNRMVYQKNLKPGRSTLSYRLGEERQVKFKSKPLFKELIDEIVESDYQKSLISGKEALKSYRVIDAMKKSARLNKIQYLR